VVSVSPALSLGLASGLALGLGLWCLVSLVPPLRRPRLTARIAPYVRDVSNQARSMTTRPSSDPAPVLGVLVSPIVEVGSRVIDTLVGGTEQTERRLRQAGLRWNISEFRARQLVWAAVAAALGVLIAIAAGRSSGASPLLQGVIILVFVVLGVVGRDYLLQRQARSRLARMQEELPTVLEFLTLSLSAGEGIVDAVRRVARIGNGELASELAHVVAEASTGVPFADSIVRTADTLQLPSFTRFVEQLTGAIDRGTPLAEVLRAQAQDAREQAKRELIESAGRKEVAMLVPLVFLILPMTVAFAIFPAVLVLQVGL
jgi:tight adherence protein C